MDKRCRELDRHHPLDSRNIVIDPLRSSSDAWLASPEGLGFVTGITVPSLERILEGQARAGGRRRKPGPANDNRDKTT